MEIQVMDSMRPESIIAFNNEIRRIMNESLPDSMVRFYPDSIDTRYLNVLARIRSSTDEAYAFECIEFSILEKSNEYIVKNLSNLIASKLINTLKKLIEDLKNGIGKNGNRK
jgi:hypothetical protein